MSPRLRHPSLALAALVTTLALSACGDDAEAPPAAPVAADGGVDLAAADCPATISVQTDWIPQSEYGYLYNMLGDDVVIDEGKKSVAGPLVANGEPTGVNLEILTGGPAIGYQTAASQLAASPEIYLATIGSDEAIQAAADYKVTAVIAPEEKSPASIMWDPETYPDVTSIAELGEAGAVVRYGPGQPFMSYLIAEGLLEEDNTDPSYDGTPGAFIAAGGKDAQYGYASNEPYVFEHETEGWNKPLSYGLIADTGYEPYVSQIAMLSKDLEAAAPCLSELVPVIQQSIVDYFADPAETNDRLVELTDAYAMGFPYSAGLAEYAAAAQVEEGLVGNGPDATIGNFDDERMAAQFEIVSGIVADTGVTLPDGLTSSDFYTNEFIDPEIGMR